MSVATRIVVRSRATFKQMAVGEGRFAAFVVGGNGVDREEQRERTRGRGQSCAPVEQRQARRRPQARRAKCAAQTSVYTLASHGKIGSRPTQSGGTSCGCVISRHLAPAGVAGQLRTRYS